MMNGHGCVLQRLNNAPACRFKPFISFKMGSKWIKEDEASKEWMK